MGGSPEHETHTTNEFLRPASFYPASPYGEAGYGRYRPVPEVVSSISRSVARELSAPDVTEQYHQRPKGRAPD